MSTEHKPLVKSVKIEDLGQQLLMSFQPQIMEVLTDLVKKYTNGDSSSIRVEVAERILISIHYVLNTYLSTFPTSSSQITLLQEKGAKALYSEGVQYLKNQIVEISTLFEELKRTQLTVPSEVYTDTFNKEIPSFIKKYDIYFNAYDTACSVDYPLIFDDFSLQGITYIHHYLLTLQLETEFCHLFSIEELNDLLMYFSRKYRIDIVNAPINLFELAFNNAFFSFVSDDLLQLTLTKPQFEHVNALLCDYPLEEVPSYIERTIDQLIDALEITDPKLIGYIDHYKTIFVPRMINALENKTLFNIPIFKEVLQEKLVFEKAPMMDDESFREVVDQLLDCMNSEEKIEILTNSIHSTEDFIDVLSADCLFGSEMRDAFNILDEIELAVLTLLVFNDDFSSTSFELDLDLIHKKIKECDVPWQLEFLHFLEDSNQKLLPILSNLCIKLG